MVEAALMSGVTPRLTSECEHRESVGPRCAGEKGDDEIVEAEHESQQRAGYQGGLDMWHQYVASCWRFARAQSFAASSCSRLNVASRARTTIVTKGEAEGDVGNSDRGQVEWPGQPAGPADP